MAIGCLCAQGSVSKKGKEISGGGRVVGAHLPASAPAPAEGPIASKVLGEVNFKTKCAEMKLHILFQSLKYPNWACNGSSTGHVQPGLTNQKTQPAICF